MEKNQKTNFIDTVYYVSSDKDDTVLMAMNIEMDKMEPIIRWFDTVKERAMNIEEILEASPERFVFKRKSDREEIYTLVPLTLELFRQNVKPYILIPQDFESHETMIKTLKQTKDNAW